MNSAPAEDSDSGAPKPRSHSSASLARSSALMASGTLVSRILGLARLALLAGAIGVQSQVANIWQTANTLPNTLYLLLAGGVLNVVFVPQFTRALSRPDRGRDLTDRMITLTLTVLFTLTVVATAGAWALTKLYAVSWTGEQLALAVALAYLCLPQIFFYGAYALLGQILNAQEQFGYYMWAPVANNIVAIAGLIVFIATFPEADTLPLGQWTTEMIWLLGGSATLGIVVQAAVLFDPVRRSGFRYRPRWGFRGVGLGAASRVAMWTLAVIAVSQFGLLLSSNVLNRAVVLEEGVPGKFVYDNAFLIFILPHSLIATSLLTAMLPALSRAAASDDLQALSYQYRHGLRLLATAMVPIAVLMLILAPQVTALLLLLSGNEATESISQVLIVLTVGLVPYGVYVLSQRVFHAFQEGRPPFQLQLVITGISVVAIAGAAFVPPEFTAVGVAAGQAAGQVAAAILGVLWVRRRVGTIAMGEVAQTYLRALAAALLAAVPTVAVQYGVDAVLTGKLAALVTLMAAGVVFMVTYGVLAHRFGVRELAEVLTPITRRLRPGRKEPAEPHTLASLAASPSPDTSSTQHPSSNTSARPRLLWESESANRTDSTPTRFTSAAHKESQVQGIDAGTVLGSRYALEELLARREDTLDYWSAHDYTLDRLVAVTVMPAIGEHAEMAHAVLDGARRTAGVDDPRLVRILDVGSEDGFCWIVEEGLSEATSLASLVAEYPLPAEEVRRIVGEAASGLESARRRGLHHLYLNPHAILRTGEGSVKISGVAVTAAIERTDEISAAESSAIDTTDLLSLLYTGLTGGWPGEEIDGLRSARRLADGTLPAPSEMVGAVPGDLDALCRSVFGAEAKMGRGPGTPGELAKVLAPWPSEIVKGKNVSPGSTAHGRDREARTAMSAGAAVAAAGSGHTEGIHGADTTDFVEPEYYRASAAGAGPGGSHYAVGADDNPTDRLPDVGRPTATGVASSGSRGEKSPHSAAGRPERSRHVPAEEEDESGNRMQSGIVLALIAAIVVVAIFFAFGAIRGLGQPDGDDQAESAGSEAQEQNSDTTEADEEDGGTPEQTEQDDEANPSSEPGGVITPSSITSYDPEGDGDENNDLTPLAIDGDPTTFWKSRIYLAENWGNLKTGVGLAIDLGEPQDITEVDVTFPEGDYRMEVYVGDEVSRSGSTQLGVVDNAAGEANVISDSAVSGQYVLIWFSEAWDSPGGEIVFVSEVTVR